MPEMKRPLVYDETHQEHLPIEEGQAVNPAYIPVDTSVPNALQVGEEGLKVSADALVSDAADNQLKSQDGKLYVAPVAAPEAEAADLVSDAEDNQLKVQDNKLYVAPLKAPEADAEALVSDAEDNRLVVQDNRLYVAPVEVPDPAPGELVSADEGNVDRYIADGLCGVTFTCGGFYTLFSIVGRACRGATVKQTPRRLPLLLVSGGDDPVGGYSSGVKKLYDKYVSAGISDVNMIIYRGARHEILNDFCAPQVREDIADFLMRVCAKEN